MRHILFFISIYLLISCNPEYKNGLQQNEIPLIFPDYTDICIPFNIAPLNFGLKGCDRIQVEIKAKNGHIQANGGYKVSFPLKTFQKLLMENKGDTLWIYVYAHFPSGWIAYRPFYWFVVKEPLDSYLTYRLIEPGYEVWNKVVLAERNISNFKERFIADNNLVEGSCMNCHIGSKQNPEKSFFHIRGPKGMTVIADGNKLRKINTKADGSYSNMIYGNWHPSGRFIAFSTNVVVPSIHNYHDKRAFVFDTISDVVVLDVEKNEVITNALLSRKDYLETFPEFSTDGERLYFCSARKVRLPEDHQRLKYSMCSIGFDPLTRTFSDRVDTLVNGPLTGKTVSEIKSSPDGKYLMYTSFSYGTFPIWHEDAKLYSYNLKTGKTDTLPELNNNARYSNSYHSWSTNSRWVVFASKRDNGMYGKPYFSYMDGRGKAHKPFVLPQEDPEFYDNTLKSYNIPELFQKSRMFDASDVENLFKSDSNTEKVKNVK